jgi:hypothetical protein
MYTHVRPWTESHDQFGVVPFGGSAGNLQGWKWNRVRFLWVLSRGGFNVVRIGDRLFFRADCMYPCVHVCVLWSLAVSLAVPNAIGGFGALLRWLVTGIKIWSFDPPRNWGFHLIIDGMMVNGRYYFIWGMEKAKRYRLQTLLCLRWERGLKWLWLLGISSGGTHGLNWIFLRHGTLSMTFLGTTLLHILIKNAMLLYLRTNILVIFQKDAWWNIYYL